MPLHRQMILPAILGTLLPTTLMSPTLGTAESTEPAMTSPSTTSQVTLKPGPAWKTISGTIKTMKGDLYIVEDYEGNQLRVYVSRDTKRLRGPNKVGDLVRAEITRDGFANSIQ
ncbi:MAG TPA: hypothetical protein PKD12_03570 [Nitrospira sp.]|nr:hypothetical protein [Nitrospira sp.]